MKTFVYISIAIVALLMIAQRLVTGEARNRIVKLLEYLSRTIVGSVFVVSGIIKANDPKGFSYKLEEYFAESALNLPFLEDYSLFLAILACLAEIVLGMAVIFGGKMKLATVTLVLFALFFGWLTFYTATCDPNGVYTVMVEGVAQERGVTCVTDCGCFGDAMKGSLGRSLTPWESFYKDLALLIFLIPILLRMGRIKLNGASEDRILLPASFLLIGFLSWVFGWTFPLLFAVITFALYLLIKKVRGEAEWSIAIMVAVLATAFAMYGQHYLPTKDYRPYAVGMSIVENMKTAEDLGLEGPIYANDFLLKNKATGEEKIFRSDIYSSEKLYKDWDFVEAQGESYKVKDGYEPLITDFIMTDEEGEDMTYGLLEGSGVLLMISYDVETAGDGMREAATLATAWQEKGNPVFGLSASMSDAVEAARHEYQMAFPWYGGDGKVLKTVIRSNPGVVLLDRGVVKGKWPESALPTLEELQAAVAD